MKGERMLKKVRDFFAGKKLEAALRKPPAPASPKPTAPPNIWGPPLPGPHSANACHSLAEQLYNLLRSQCPPAEASIAVSLCAYRIKKETGFHSVVQEEIPVQNRRWRANPGLVSRN